MSILCAALCGFVLDLLFGDPESLTATHPVVLIGHCISFLEKLLRKLFPCGAELLSGALLALLIPLGTFGISFGALCILGKYAPPLAFAVQALWCWRALAVKNLRDESLRVFRALSAIRADASAGSEIPVRPDASMQSAVSMPSIDPGDAEAAQEEGLSAARRAVGRIVGRDTASLTAEGVARATVETVAENFSDGVVAPMLYMFLGGAPLALAYKSINTMDSMLGYKNETYLYFGRAAAKLDDAVNFLPSRLSALLLIAAAALAGQDAGEAFRIWWRDRRKHESPNSAQSESAMAGALRVQLGGPAYYFGVLHEKPFLGDASRPVEPQDIVRANCMLYIGSLLGLALFCVFRTAALCLAAGIV